jgi:hypothetical protein
MRLICPKHGIQAPMQLSPDIWEEPWKADKERGGIKVEYEFNGETVDAFLLSADFAKRVGAIDGPLPLPDQYPPWMDQLLAVCSKCLAEKTASRNHLAE